MRNIAKIWTLPALLALTLVACNKMPVLPDVPGIPGDGIVLKLDTDEMAIRTKADATRPGDDDGAFNENVLGSAVDIFFFPEGATDDTPSVKSLRVNVSSTGFVQIPVTMGDIDTIFGNSVQGSKSEVYVVANYTGTAFTHDRSYTLAELKGLNLAPADWSVFPQTSFVMTGKSTLTLEDASAATPASGTIRMRRVAAKVTFRLTVADEIVVENITRDQEGKIQNKTLEAWHPVKTAMTAYLQYAMKPGKLGGEPIAVPADPKSQAAANQLYTYGENRLVESALTISRHRTIIDEIIHHEKTETEPEEWEVVSHEETPDVPVYVTKYYEGETMKSDGPFYSYPVSWEPGVQTEPFIKLVIPWNNGTSTKYYYYKVPFSGTELISNNWYEITLDVQILGGEDEQPIPLEATYKVVDWVPGTVSEASVVDARYLSVPKTEWVMYNTEELVIPITSSHDVQIVGYYVKSAASSATDRAKGKAFTSGDKNADDSWIGSNPRIYNPFTETRYNINSTATVGTVYATKPNYNYSSGNTSFNGNPVPSNVNATSWFPTAQISRDQIVFKHPLNNDTSTNNYDVAPYYVRIRVQHKDDPNYYRDILIEQRPAIVIEAQRNSDEGYVNSSGFTTNNGYAWVNKVRTDNNTSGRNNTNFNMYVIETSVLPTSGTMASFVLGDPRESSYTATPGDAQTNYYVQAPTVDRGNNQRLAYYYPAGVSDIYDDYVAPKFRIASSFGASPTMSRQDAIRRCASYQEDGYPAGRWRLPTVAEIKFMAQLTSDNYIPRLLGNTSTGSTYYWCNSAAVRIDNAGRTGGVRDPEKVERTEDSNVRCVYDEWFWENTTFEKVNKTTFTWGDQQRTSVVRTKAQ